MAKWRLERLAFSTRAPDREQFYDRSAREMRVHCAGRAEEEPRTRRVGLGLGLGLPKRRLRRLPPWRLRCLALQVGLHSAWCRQYNGSISMVAYGT